MKKYILLLLLAPLQVAAQIDEANLEKYFSLIELKSANTADTVEYLTQDEKNIFLYSNLSRMYPRKFYVLYRDFVTNRNGAGVLESDYYYSSLAKELKTMEPRGALLPSRRLFELAECWAVESGEKGIIGHDREDCPGGGFGENCSYGYSNGLKIVMQLLIDHGVESLGHRKNIFRTSYKGLGTAIRKHKTYGWCAVQDFNFSNDQIRLEQEREKARREKERQAYQKKLDARELEFEEVMNSWTPDERSQADACRDLDYLNDFEKDFYFYVNLIRLDPRKFKRLIWDRGPYFDRLEEEQVGDIRQDPSYKRFGQWLNGAASRPVFVPSKESIETGRCIIQAYNAGRQAKGCIKSFTFRYWSIVAGYGGFQNHHNKIVQLLMEEKENQNKDLMAANGILVVDPDNGVELFLRR